VLFAPLLAVIFSLHPVEEKNGNERDSFQPDRDVLMRLKPSPHVHECNVQLDRNLAQTCQARENDKERRRRIPRAKRLALRDRCSASCVCADPQALERDVTRSRKVEFQGKSKLWTSFQADRIAQHSVKRNLEFRHYLSFANPRMPQGRLHGHSRFPEENGASESIWR